MVAILDEIFAFIKKIVLWDFLKTTKSKKIFNKTKQITQKLNFSKCSDIEKKTWSSLFSISAADNLE